MRLEFWIDRDNPRRPRLRVGQWIIVGVLAWYDMWIGAYYDRMNRRLYVLPLPCIGVYVFRSDLPNAGLTDTPRAGKAGT